MALTTNILIPIIKGVFTAGYVIGFLGLIIWLSRKYIFTKKRNLWIKFNIFKRPYPEDQVEWCMDALDKGWHEEKEVRKVLLTKSNFPEKKVNQILFIFSELKAMKGGNKDVRFKQSSGETQFPKIREKGSK